MGFLTWITLVGLVGLAFGGGIWFASMRRSVGSNRTGSDRAPVPSAGFALSAPRPPAYELPEYVPGDEPPADHGASAEGDFADDDLLTNPTVRFKDGH